MKSKILISVFSVLLIASIVFNIYIYAPYVFGKMHRGDGICIYTDLDYAHGRHMIYGKQYIVKYSDGHLQCLFIANNDIDSIESGEKEYEEGYHVHSAMDVSCYEDLRTLINKSNLKEIKGAKWSGGFFDFPTAEFKAPFVIVLGNSVYVSDDVEILELIQKYDDRVSKTVYNLG